MNKTQVTINVNTNENPIAYQDARLDILELVRLAFKKNNLPWSTIDLDINYSNAAKN